MEKQLLEAVEKGELRIALKPVLGIKEPRNICFQVVPRWASAFGLLEYSEFASTCDDLDLREAFWDRYIELTCSTMASWTLRKKDLPRIVLAVPDLYVERRDLARFVERVTAVFAVDPVLFAIQVSASAFRDWTPVATFNLASLRALGLAIRANERDVEELPLLFQCARPDVLVLDKRCVRMLLRPHLAELLQAVVAAARRVGCALAADGVSCLRECGDLIAAGFDEIQGSFVGDPISRATAERLYLI